LKAVPVDGRRQLDPTVPAAEFPMVGRQIVVDRHLFFPGTVHETSPFPCREFPAYAQNCRRQSRRCDQYCWISGKISASTHQAAWYSTRAASGSAVRPPVMASSRPSTQPNSAEADTSREALCSPSAAPAAASRPPTKLAKLPRCIMLPSLSGSQAMAGSSALRSCSLSTLTEPEGRL